MGEIEDFGLRSTDNTTLKILEYIANNPRSSRTDLRDVTKGVKTIENSLLFLEMIGAISITREEYKGKEAWFSGITNLGYQMLINAGFKIKREFSRSKKHKPLQVTDMEKLNGLFLGAKRQGYFPEEHGGMANITEQWISNYNAGQKTILLDISKEILNIMDKLKENTLFQTREYMDLYYGLEATIEELEKELYEF